MLALKLEFHNLSKTGMKYLSILNKFKNFYYLAISIIVLILINVIVFKNFESEKFDTQTKLFNNFLVKLGFSINHIDIHGTKYLSNTKIHNVFENYKAVSIFTVDLNRVHKEISKYNWIKSVHLKRVMPNKIKVSLIENEPIAIWQNKKGNNILTKEGVLISDYNFNVFKNKLPIIKGENIDQNIIEILDILKTNKSMANEIWSLSYINMRRWDLHFKQGLVIRLPSKNPTEAWKLAAKLNQKYNILNLGLTEIDLRNSKQILGKINFDKGLIINRKSS